MKLGLTEKQLEIQEQVKEFTQKHITPNAGKIDREERLDPEIIRKMGEEKYLGIILPESVGGAGNDMISFSVINEEIGKGCSSTRSLITVHSMCSFAIMRWGKDEQKEKWLSDLATGKKIGCFALSEPKVGSDGGGIQTEITEDGDDYILNGQKKWITYGQIADMFLIVGKMDGAAVALIVERDAPGLRTTPITGMLGTRGSMLANVFMENCRIPKKNRLGGVGFGFSAVALSALDIGRLSVATGSVGIAQACLQASLSYAGTRKQFDTELSQFQLIRRMLADMSTKVKAAQLLCYRGAYLLENASPMATNEIMTAKYFASTTANEAAKDAVQIHGAVGCTDDYPVARLYRDAKVMEIIEGSNEINQLVLGKCNFM